MIVDIGSAFSMRIVKEIGRHEFLDCICDLFGLNCGLFLFDRFGRLFSFDS